MVKIFFTIVLISILSIYISTDEEMKRLKLQYDNHIVKKAQTWKDWKDKSVVERITVAPTDVIEYVTIENKVYEYNALPTKVAIDSDLKHDLIAAIKELPEQIRKKLEHNVIGIFILSGLGSTGYTEHVYNGDEYEGAFIVFDQDVLLNITANEWATWRTNSAFKKSDDYALSLKIEENSTNTRKQAITFILLHEIAHVLAIAVNSHPRSAQGDPKLFDFSSISWRSYNDSIYDKNFKHRKDFKLYSFDKATLELEDSKRMISDLKNTDFCSLYASNSFFEDFAEAYTIYVHTVLMKKPYRLTLYHKGKKIESFENPFMMKNLQKKRDYFDKLFLIRSE